ncbi:MAG: efflux RND transporter periplasmic adaptor subunit [Pseudomonadota bacterium]
MVVALAAGGLYALVAEDKDGPRYRTLPVARGEIIQRVLATGTVNPVILVQVGSQVSGTISAIHADFNSIVKKGEVVARIDPALFRAEVAKAKANHEKALADVEKMKATLENAALTRTRMETMVRRDLIARADADDARLKADTAKADLAAARANVSQLKAALDVAETNLQYTVIRSPVDGIVVDRSVDVGQTVAASLQAPVLFKIAQDLSQMQVDTNVDEADIGKIKLAQPVSFTVDAYPGAEFSGRVAQIRNAPQQVQNVITYDVVVTVDNRDLKLKPGMTANVSVTTDRRPGVLKVPNAALRFVPQPSGEDKQPQPAEGAEEDRQRQKVWVLARGGRLATVPVKVGISDGDYSELSAGRLTEGQRVVVEQLDEKAKASKSQPRLF